MLDHPFKNDPFAIVYKAFKNLYPGKDCKIQWAAELKDEEGIPVFGVTTFRRTAEKTDVFVSVDPGLQVWDAIEVLAHELAHVAIFPEHQDHDRKWEETVDAIFEEYNRVSAELFPNATHQTKDGGGRVM